MTFVAVVQYAASEPMLATRIHAGEIASQCTLELICRALERLFPIDDSELFAGRRVRLQPPIHDILETH